MDLDKIGHSASFTPLQKPYVQAPKQSSSNIIPRPEFIPKTVGTIPSSDSPVAFQPTIVIIQNVFTLPASLLAQLQNLSGGPESFITVQNQEVFVFPNSIQVSQVSSSNSVPTHSFNSNSSSSFLKISNSHSNNFQQS